MDWTLLSFGPSGWGDELAWGFGLTLSLAISAYGLGLILGSVFALVEIGRGRFLPRLFGTYAAGIRSLPELLVIFFTYYGFASLIEALFALFGVELTLSVSPFVAAVIALAIVQGAYTSEVVKGAIRAVPGGMAEAAEALGFRPAGTFRLVVLPLALRNAFPGLVNLWMVVIKNTPFASAIGLQDFIRAAGTAGQNTKHYFVFYGVVFVVYLVISAASMIVQGRLEERLYRFMRTAGQ